jgi:hypothetical protein
MRLNGKIAVTGMLTSSITHYASQIFWDPILLELGLARGDFGVDRQLWVRVCSGAARGTRLGHCCR